MGKVEESSLTFSQHNQHQSTSSQHSQSSNSIQYAGIFLSCCFTATCSWCTKPIILFYLSQHHHQHKGICSHHASSSQAQSTVQQTSGVSSQVPSSSVSVSHAAICNWCCKAISHCMLHQQLQPTIHLNLPMK